MKRKILKSGICAIFFFVGFVWLHTFIRMNSYGSSNGVFGYIVPALCTMIGTIFSYWCIIGSFDDSVEERFDIDRHKCMVASGMLCLILLTALILELSCDSFSVYGDKEIRLWIFEIPKKYLFDVEAIIFFPLSVEVIFKAMRKEEFSRRSTVFACLQIFSLSVAEYLVFYAMANIWLVDLAVLNIVTLSVAIHKYVWNSNLVRKGNIVGFILLYVLIWITGLHLLGRGSKDIASYMYRGDWDEYTEYVSVLVRNASFFGTSGKLTGMESVREWLYNQSNFIQQLLYYGGWSSVIGLLAFMTGFLVTAFKMLGKRHFQIHRHQVIYMTAFGMFVSRTVMGSLYAFALVPYPVALPFAGTTGIITDSIAFALLLICMWECYQIDKIESCRLADAAEFLEENIEYTVLKKGGGGDCDEEGDMDTVIVQGKEKQVCCTAVWFECFPEEYAVFKPQGINNEVFILKNEEKDVWKPVNDEGIMQAVFCEYVESLIPDCVEVGYETEDSEY